MVENEGREMSKCVWTEDEEGYWDTACGEKHEFIIGSPSENNYVFCPYCGDNIEEVKYECEADADA